MNGDIIYAVLVAGVAFIAVASPVVHYVSAQRVNKIGISGLKELIEQIDKKTEHKQDTKMCNERHETIAAQLRQNRESIGKLFDTTDVIRETVVRIETKIDRNGKFTG